jgi:hypothetical protein
MRWLLLLLVFAPAGNAIPVVPNFKQGSLTSHTETTSKVTETIVSENFGTGWEYTATGVNVQHDGNSLTPGTTSVNSWTGLDTNAKPNWTIVNPGEAFQFSETYSGPGLSNITTIQKLTEVTQITDTISTFSE